MQSTQASRLAVMGIAADISFQINIQGTMIHFAANGKVSIDGTMIQEDVETFELNQRLLTLTPKCRQSNSSLNWCEVLNMPYELVRHGSFTI